MANTRDDATPKAQPAARRRSRRKHRRKKGSVVDFDVFDVVFQILSAIW